jgi:hypothetical protein
MRDQPEARDVADILACEDHATLVWEMYLHVLRKEEQVGIEALSQPERSLLCVTRLEAEVNNGGFDQYFFNSSGDWAALTLPALVEIGAEHTAGIFRRALSAFPGGRPTPDRAARWKEMEQAAAEQLFRALDHSFYGEKDNLVELLAHYIKRNRSAFAG